MLVIGVWCRVLSPGVTAEPMEQTPRTLGEVIEDRRQQLGLTKSKAARLAGVSRGTWHEVESGKRTHMLADTLNLFDKALGYERGTLRNLGKAPKPVPTVPAGSDDENELRMQLVRYAMTQPLQEIRNLTAIITERAQGDDDWLRSQIKAEVQRHLATLNHDDGHDDERGAPHVRERGAERPGPRERERSASRAR